MNTHNTLSYFHNEVTQKYNIYVLYNFIFRFRDGQGNGGWLRHTELVANSQQVGVVLGSSITNGGQLKTDLLHIPGFQMLGW